jgi:MarR family transcriptional regulator, negative regulator of the multidrug operon emrRAB
MQEAMASSVAGHGASGPAALVALDGEAGGGSIDALRRILGITHSGTVRLVDRLAGAGLVERRVGADARAVALHLTPQGRRLARRVLAAAKRRSSRSSPRSQPRSDARSGHFWAR